MNAEDLTHLKKLIVFTASYYGRDLKPEAVTMMADDLCDLPIRDVMSAYTRYRQTDKTGRFPLPAQIRGLVQPDVDPDSAAKEIAARITGAITKFGWANGIEAKAYIGDIGWGIVERQGGWMHLCQNHGVTINPGTFQAQVRDLAASSLKFPEHAMQAAIGIGSGAKPGELQSLGEIMTLIPATGDNN